MTKPIFVKKQKFAFVLNHPAIYLWFAAISENSSVLNVQKLLKFDYTEGRTEISQNVIFM